MPTGLLSASDDRCRLCRDTTTSIARARRCAFPGGAFTSTNEHCATLEAIRSALVVHRTTDTRLRGGIAPVPSAAGLDDGFALLIWRDEATIRAAHFIGERVCRPLTLADAERIVASLRSGA